MDHRNPNHHVVKPPTTISSMLNEPAAYKEPCGGDSAYASQNNSKHSSLSNAHNGINTQHMGPGDRHSAEKTPSPVFNGLAPHHSSSPTGAMSVASIVSPTIPEHRDMTAHNRLSDNRLSVQTMDSAIHNGSHNGDSRRESVDSRLGANFGDMRLSNASPYASNNQSTTSLQSSLAQQRNPGANDRPHLGLRFSDQFSPRSSRFSQASDSISPTRGVLTSKTAPQIHGPPSREIAEAAHAIPGQPWALDFNADPSEADAHVNRQGTSFFNDDSRRNSFTESIASSAYTTESRLPQGQRRLDDPNEINNRLSRASSELQVSTHHHSLQHRQVADLQGEGTSPGGSQPYSRTPELRVSHKLAERKRRTEMKDLFDQLRDLMPQERGSKASKWEILTKAIFEYGRAMSDITRLSVKIRSAEQELETSRREAAALRLENSQLRGELAAFANSHRPAPQPAMNNDYPPPQQHSMYGGNPVDRNPQQGHDNYAIRSAEQLPPIRNAISSHPQAPEAMSGIQYQNGYRTAVTHF